MKNNPDTMIVDINKASMEQLQYLPEVGPVTAQDIVNGRPYESVEDLKKVRGIGEKTFQKIRPRVKLE
ncbi:helix-hairpin-helix domain-containing protein [Phragmitibacter flavus]|uniref:Helix-hairpin-helix domain-containing protein n=2 Tax=Phragmitibacter flavus TaxID=2576071 RepID=A0A5R8KHN9_9BACT|nr:helix-hairpin-helix domain-containing protein [Phragmitibacter flavus]